jgi:hypothetical protein
VSPEGRHQDGIRAVAAADIQHAWPFVTAHECDRELQWKSGCARRDAPVSIQYPFVQRRQAGAPSPGCLIEELRFLAMTLGG